MADYTISGYIATAKSLSDKIIAIDTLIDSMLVKMTESIDTSDTISYRLDTGQMVINQEFRSVSDLEKSIEKLETLKQIYVNRLNGRVTIMRGGVNHRYGY